MSVDMFASPKTRSKDRHIFMAFRSTCVLTVLILISICVDVNSDRPSRCSMAFPRAKGYCVHKRMPCPSGTVVYPRYSTYVYCLQANRKCCGPPNRPVVPTARPTQRPTPSRPTLNCGIGSLVTTDRILNGIEAGQCDWPFVVSIRALRRDESQLSYATTTHACAGVLVDPNWVLTSAFCVLSAGGSADDAPNRFYVVAGEHNINQIDIYPVDGRQQEQLLRIERAILHPDYQYTNISEVFFDNPLLINGNGVALLKLRQPITGRCAGIACLPTQDEADDECASYDECVITGWGLTSEEIADSSGRLNLGRVRLSSQDTCDFLTAFWQLSAQRPEGSICQAPVGGNTDTCLGDEGGAVLCGTNSRWVVRAIIPFNMCVNDNFNLYVTDVAPYLDWIDAIMDRFSF